MSNLTSIFLSGGLKTGWQDEARFIIDAADVAVRYFDPRTWQDSQTSSADYTKRDIDAIKECQIILAYMDSHNPSGLGLSVELGYAAALGRKIVFCGPVKHDWRSPYFGMHRALSDHYCDTLVGGCRAVIEFARGGVLRNPDKAMV